VTEAGGDLDFPVLGTLLFALGTWGMHVGSVPTDDAVHLVVLAERFAYNRFNPSLSWDAASDAAERVAPGVVARIQELYGERRGPDLLEEARALLARLYG
jgi:hypothetical protein